MAKWFDRIGTMLCEKLYDPRDKDKNMLSHIQYMLNRTQRMFEYTGLPDTIPQRMIELYLQINGHLAFAKYNGDLYVYTGGLGGEPDVYYQPTIYTIANPAQNWSKNLSIGSDCIVIRNDSLYLGLLPLFRRYAHALSENELSLHIADVNSRMISLISATDDRTIESARRYLDDIEKGKLGVIADNAFLEGLKAQPVNASTSKNGILDLMEYEQFLKASWYNEIGLDSNYNMKRERLNTAEVEMNNDSLAPLIDDMLESRRIGLEAVNALFGTSITVELSSAWERNRKEEDAMLRDILNEDDEEDIYTGGGGGEDDNGTD